MTPIPAHRTVRMLLLAWMLALSGPSVPALAVDPDLVGVWPLQPEAEVVRGFEPPSSEYGAGHRGVDLAGSLGQTVRSALPGRVTFAGRLAGRGVVVVDHGDTRTTYEPVTATAHLGDQVAAGQPIGRLELVGSHCFPAACLHWGWIRGDVYLDPLGLVGRGPVRLLPLAGLPPTQPQGTTVARPYADWQPLFRQLSLLAGLLGLATWLVDPEPADR
jgi:murein DD-endopeptidase MepM/ murein hydrolase activator NlpD